jgi:hypothetical protein
MSETTVPGAFGASERRPGLRAAATVAAQIARPIVAKHGGGVLARLKSEWAAIVGPELAGSAWPEALARGGTLKLRIAPTSALAIQHSAAIVVERINLFFGREAVTRLALVQGPLPLQAAPGRTIPRPLAAGEADTLGRQLETVGDPQLREALDRLGRAVLGSTER